MAKLIAVRVSRRYDFPPERVFDAWIDPKIAGRWLFTSPTSETNDTKMDAKVGGKWSITDRRDGVDYTAIGEYLEIDRPRRLVFSFGMPQFSPESCTVTVEIVRDGNGCILNLTQEPTPEETEAGLIDGWNQMFENLAAILTSHGTPGEMGTAPLVRFERRLSGPIERVWEFLTNPARLPAWFGNGTIEPRAGGAVYLMDGHIRGVVTQWDPPRKLAYSWNVFNPGEDRSDYPESYLTITLEPAGDDVLLTLTHLPVLERFEKQNAMGWHTYLDMLSAAVRGGPVEDRPAYMKRNAALYGVDLNNLAR